MLELKLTPATSSEQTVSVWFATTGSGLTVTVISNGWPIQPSADVGVTE